MSSSSARAAPLRSRPAARIHCIAEMCKLLGIAKSRTTPYHPQDDGQVERSNQTLLAMLATVVGHIQNPRAPRQRPVMHFDHLKSCLSDIRSPVTVPPASLSMENRPGEPSLQPPGTTLKSWTMSTQQIVTCSGSSHQGPHLIIPSGSVRPLTTTVQISTSTQSRVGFTLMRGLCDSI